MTALSFVILGISSLTVQMVLLRELWTVFYGNEFFANLTLGSWLFWTAAGSFLAKRFLQKLKPEGIPSASVICFATLPFLILAELVGIRMSGALSGSAGETPNLLAGTFSGFFILAPACTGYGLLFPLLMAGRTSEHPPASRTRMAYFWETTGFMLGGLAYGFFLIWQNSFRALGTVAFLHLVVVAAGWFFVVPKKKNRPFSVTALWTLLVLALCLTLWIPALSDPLDRLSQKPRFSGQTFKESLNSITGNITVTQSGNQINLFDAGSLTSPAGDPLTYEPLVHLPLLLHPAPKKILLIGSGGADYLREILKYNPDRIVVAEPNPALLAVLRKYFPEELTKIFKTPAVEIVTGDPIAYLGRDRELFDAVICNLPAPSSALINRFYTAEFFSTVKGHLQSGGIFTTHLPYSPSASNRELQNLNAAIFQTLRGEFPNVLCLADDTNIFIASRNSFSERFTETAVRRFTEKKINARFVSADYLRFRYQNDRNESTTRAFENNDRVKTNRCFVPSGYYYGTLYFLSRFNPGLTRNLEFFYKMKLSWLLLIIFGAAGFRAVKKSGSRGRLCLAMGTAGFSLLFIQSIFILAFQAFFGNLYYRITFLFTALMGGMALGSLLPDVVPWGGVRQRKKEMLTPPLGTTSDQGQITTLHVLLGGYSLLLVAGLIFLPKTEIMFYILSAVAGLLVGLEFAVANKIYLESVSGAKNKTGVLYGADLAGSCLGILAAPIFFIPILGIPGSLVFLAALNFLIALLSKTLRFNFSPSRPA